MRPCVGDQPSGVGLSPPLMRLLALLHRLGVNPALVVGLLLMPAVVAMGYWADTGQDEPPALTLRGSLDAVSFGPVSRPTLPF